MTPKRPALTRTALKSALSGSRTISKSGDGPSAVGDQVDGVDGVGEGRSVEVAAVRPGVHSADNRLAARTPQRLESPRTGEVCDAIEVFLHEAAEGLLPLQVVDLVELRIELADALAGLDVDERAPDIGEAWVPHLFQQVGVQGSWNGGEQRPGQPRHGAVGLPGLDEGVVADRRLRESPVAPRGLESLRRGPAAQVDDVVQGAWERDLRNGHAGSSRIVVLSTPPRIELRLHHVRLPRLRL
jgi:hypothetical protein